MCGTHLTNMRPWEETDTQLLIIYAGFLSLFIGIGDTLSKNWLKLMALKDMEEDAALLQLLEPSC